MKIFWTYLPSYEKSSSQTCNSLAEVQKVFESLSIFYILNGHLYGATLVHLQMLLNEHKYLPQICECIVGTGNRHYDANSQQGFDMSQQYFAHVLWVEAVY